MGKIPLPLTPVTPGNKYLLVIDVADAIGACRGRGGEEYDRALGDVGEIICRAPRYGDMPATTGCGDDA